MPSAAEKPNPMNSARSSIAMSSAEQPRDFLESTWVGSTNQAATAIATVMYIVPTPAHTTTITSTKQHRAASVIPMHVVYVAVTKKTKLR